MKKKKTIQELIDEVEGGKIQAMSFTLTDGDAMIDMLVAISEGEMGDVVEYTTSARVHTKRKTLEEGWVKFTALPDE